MSFCRAIEAVTHLEGPRIVRGQDKEGDVFILFLCRPHQADHNNKRIIHSGRLGIVWEVVCTIIGKSKNVFRGMFTITL